MFVGISASNVCEFPDRRLLQPYSSTPLAKSSWQTVAVVLHARIGIAVYKAITAAPYLFLVKTRCVLRTANAALQLDAVALEPLPCIFPQATSLLDLCRIRILDHKALIWDICVC